MSWQDRLSEAAYTTPSGQRLVFVYENVRKSFSKKTSAFEFPDAIGTFIQDNGRSGRRLPLRIFFNGDDYDLEATTFEDGLAEPGRGKLEHPIYGTIDVVPFGIIGRRDDLKTAANQAVLEVTFWETIDLLFPSAQTDPGSEVLTAVDEYNTAEAEQFEEVLDIDTVTEEVTFQNRYQLVLDIAQSALQNIADVQDDVQRQFNAVFDSINNGIDILVQDPLTLAFQTTILLQAPARADASIQARLDAYSNLANTIITGENAIRTPGNDSQEANAFQNDDLFVSTLVTGAIVSVVNNQFETKTEALSAAEEILDLANTVTVWRDANYESLGLIDTGSAYQQFQEAVALTAGFLVEISFSLKQERSIILTYDRTIIDVVAELYGTVDEQLDFFIASNDLTGTEILELPKGKEVRYFV
ncbi:DNA circularization N-terminal domain-containing protein [Candidatus Pacearchaeota archaeon]|nr:DNA circularization N-terminal domain-containing protein [Candidatus Pacearchaeota archaeon]